MNTVLCPACGAIVESDDEGDLIARVREHTETAHDYVIPSEHVLLAMNRDDEFH